ncbi:MAG: hypothetical protein LBT44_05085 [Clostridiales bacterium]|nr:hypothetical protein [Clostridiales bacterium]
MRQFTAFGAALMYFLLFFFCLSANAMERPNPIRVGYVESEEYSAFARNLSGIALGLREIGLISGFHPDMDESNARTVWSALSASSGGNFLFAPDMFFSMKGMDEAEYSQFTNHKDVDLLIVMGTAAGVYMTGHETQNDYMVFAAANPVLSGIVKSETERFKPNSYAYIDPSRYRRQLDTAFRVFEIKKLGVVYEDNTFAYAYSGVAQAKQSAAGHGFALTEKHVAEALDDSDKGRYYREMKAAYGELIADGIDGLYITTATTEDYMLPWLLADITAAGVATISQVGESQVENGVMLSVTLEDVIDQGRFAAYRLREYKDGKPIDALGQVFEIVPKIFLNYDACQMAGIHPPFKTLLSMDGIIRARGGAKP